MLSEAFVVFLNGWQERLVCRGRFGGDDDEMSWGFTTKLQLRQTVVEN